MAFEFERFDEMKKSKGATTFFCLVLPIAVGICLILAVAAIIVAQPRGQAPQNETGVLKEQLKGQDLVIKALRLKVDEQEAALKMLAAKFNSTNLKIDATIATLEEGMKIQEFQVKKQLGSKGGVYTRWGRDVCGNNSKLIYKGTAGGADFDHTGGGVNFQCLPEVPEHNRFSAGRNSSWFGSLMYGVEYRSAKYGIFPDSAHEQNAPCARCHTKNRTAVVMIPGKRTCPSEWTKEYEGYLMASNLGHAHPSTYECVDANPQYVPGEGHSSLDAFFYFVKPSCDGVPCPPYSVEREITCVMCSK